jgi:lipoyl(octanoyl) transferase
MSGIQVRQLGLQPYLPVLKAMRAFTDTRTMETPDQLWCLQHYPVFTQGQAGKAEHVLTPGNIPVIQVDRGGQVTYHGPGQIVIYILVNLKRRSLNVRQLVDGIESSVIALLADYGIEGRGREGAPGIFVDGGKICSLGLRIRRGSSYHGMAFNADLDLAPFGRINPCGYPGLVMTRLKDLLPGAEMPKVDVLATQLLDKLSVCLGFGGWWCETDDNSPVAMDEGRAAL